MSTITLPSRLCAVHQASCPSPWAMKDAVTVAPFGQVTATSRLAVRLVTSYAHRPSMRSALPSLCVLTSRVFRSRNRSGWYGLPFGRVFGRVCTAPGHTLAMSG